MPIGTFGFEDLSSNDKALRTFTRAFGRLGANVVQTEVPQRIKRTAGISYKEVNLTFADSQTVTLCVKKTGDIFQVKLNGKALPIRNQDDQKKAVKEIVDAMDSGRAAFQRKLARQPENVLHARREPVRGGIVLQVAAEHGAVFFQLDARLRQKAARRAVRDAEHGEEQVLAADIGRVIVLRRLAGEFHRLAQVVGESGYIQRFHSVIPN